MQGREDLVLMCPHCEGAVLVAKTELNCRIFRHAVYKATGQPISPHAPQAMCETLLAQDAVVGCAKPFRVVDDSTTPGQYRTEACPYI
jgi:hypothetical protein